MQQQKKALIFPNKNKIKKYAVVLKAFQRNFIWRKATVYIEKWYTMAARLWRPRDDNDNREKDIEKDTEKDIDRKAISDEMQMAALNAHQYMSQNGKWKDFLKNKTNQQNILLKES